MNLRVKVLCHISRNCVPLLFNVKQKSSTFTTAQLARSVQCRFYTVKLQLMLINLFQSLNEACYIWDKSRNLKLLAQNSWSALNMCLLLLFIFKPLCAESASARAREGESACEWARVRSAVLAISLFTWFCVGNTLSNMFKLKFTTYTSSYVSLY